MGPAVFDALPRLSSPALLISAVIDGGSPKRSAPVTRFQARVVVTLGAIRSKGKRPLALAPAGDRATTRASKPAYACCVRRALGVVGVPPPWIALGSETAWRRIWDRAYTAASASD